MDTPVSAALGEVIHLYALKHIQNNLAEHKNSLLSNSLVLTGLKTIESIEKRIRACIICQNNPTILDSITIHHNFQYSFLNTQILNSPLLDILVC